MKNAVTILFVIGGIGLSAHLGLAQAPKKTMSSKAQSKYSYGIGFELGKSWKERGVRVEDMDFQSLIQGIQDSLSGSSRLLPQKETRAAMNEFRTVISKRAQAQKKKAAKINKAKAKQFLKKNRSKEGVKTLSSGLQYKVLKKGDGETPKRWDKVKVHYRGKLLDGTVFDSSYERGKPSTFAANRVVKGWTQALTRMSVGGKWRLFIPPELGYGETGKPPRIGPNQALIFDVELLGVNRQEPVTSDIIKVPSKEELEKGAKVEVIKKDEVEKQKKEQEEKKKKKEKEE